MCFTKILLDYLGCTNKWNEPASHFGPSKVTKCSENGLFWNQKMGQKWVKNGSKMGQNCVFPKMILDHLGCLNKSNEPIFSPLQAILATPKSQNALKMGCFVTKNQSKMDQKCVFPKIILDYLGCTNKWNEPSLSPCGAILAPLKAERALKMGQFGTTNGSKTGQTHGFPRMILVQLWCPNG